MEKQSSVTSPIPVEKSPPPRVEILLLLLGIVALFSAPHSISGDGQVRFELLSMLLKGEHLPTTGYSLIGPLFASPLYLLGHFYASPEWWCAQFNLVLLLSGSLYANHLLRESLSATNRSRFLLIWLLASMVPHNQTAFYGEVFTTVFLGLGILSITLGQRKSGAVLVALGAANTPATLAGLILLAFYWVIKRRHGSFLFALALGIVLVSLENWIRRGGFTVTGYEGNAGYQTLLPYSGLPGFSYPFFFGLISILFSFGKGIFWFIPGLLLVAKKWQAPATPKPLADAQLSWLILLTGLVIVYSKWWSWYGGWFWGPRFFLIATLPASLALTWALAKEQHRLLDHLMVMAVLVLSFWVGLDGLLFGQNNMGDICTIQNYAIEAFCWYLPEFSAIFRPFVAPTPLQIYHLLVIMLYILIFFYLATPVAKKIWRGLSR